jgi:YHS domain-containing protein
MTSATVVDPVCGMPVDPAAADIVVDNAGRRYHFCESACADTFRDDPDRWAPRAAVTANEPGA